MSHHGQIARPHDCWFCSYTNLSYIFQCGRCEAAIIPTRDSTEKTIEWTHFTFSSDATVSERSSFSQFNKAQEIFNIKDRVVIRLSNRQSQRYILVRHTPQVAFYSYRVNNKGVYNTVTVRWAEATKQEKELLVRFVDENLEDTKGESTLLRVFCSLT